MAITDRTVNGFKYTIEVKEVESGSFHFYVYFRGKLVATSEMEESTSYREEHKAFMSAKNWCSMYTPTGAIR